MATYTSTVGASNKEVHGTTGVVREDSAHVSAKNQNQNSGFNTKTSSQTCNWCSNTFIVTVANLNDTQQITSLTSIVGQSTGHRQICSDIVNTYI